MKNAGQRLFSGGTLLAAAGMSPTLRAEALAVRDFARLAYTLERWPVS